MLMSRLSTTTTTECEDRARILKQNSQFVCAEPSKLTIVQSDFPTFVILLKKHKWPFQGSIVVFSAYGNWTYSYDAEDVGLPDYCAKPPFECALVVLIINWVESYCIFSLL